LFVDSPFNCGDNPYYCKNLSCRAYYGCDFVFRDCQVNASNQTCTTANCSESLRACVKAELPCFFFLGILAGIITAGLIAGVIAAAILIAAAMAGSTAYAVSVTNVTETESSIQKNPLYTPKGKIRENPLSNMGNHIGNDFDDGKFAV